MSKRERLVVVFVFHRLRVDAEGSVPCVEDGSDVVGGLFDVHTERVGLAHDNPLTDSATGHGDAPCLWPVITAGMAVDARGSSELAHGDDKRAFEEARSGEILENRGEGLIELRNETGVRVEVVAVGVPSEAGDFYESDASF